MSKGERRSPRLCALDAWRKAQHSRPLALALGPASRTRARKKRKLKPLEDVADVRLDSKYYDMWISESPHREENNISTSALPAQWMPEKQILELILDILQRRDTYEIFSEPVDPEEVEDYYEIIQEPMDFGTMRAKLHEGMYTNLEQFEHDVFLISTNAMHFNSSATIYFRQARAIHELAKKVFHALKTDPANFELEFSEARRTTGRRSSKEAGGMSKSTSSKLTTNLRSDSLPALSSSMMPRLLSPSNVKKNIRQGPGCSNTTSFNTRDHKKLSGSGGVARNDFSGDDPRCSYRPWMSCLNKSDSIVSTVHNSKQLILVDGMGISYRDSLMLFAKDLGPTAQMVARRKLSGCFIDASNFRNPSSTPENPAVYADASQIPDPAITTGSKSLLERLHDNHAVFGNANGKTNQLNAGETDESYGRNGMVICGVFTGEASKSNRKKIPNALSWGECNGNVMRFGTRNGGAILKEMSQNSDKKIPSALRWEDHNGPAINASGAFSGENIHQNHSRTAIHLYPFANGARESMGEECKFDHQVEPLSSTCKHAEVNIPNLCFRNNSNPLPSLLPQVMGISGGVQMEGSITNQYSWCLRRGDQERAAQEARKVSSSTKSGQVPIAGRPLPPSSPFIFDLPYLKARLDQINSSRKHEACWREMDAEEDPSLQGVRYEKELNFGHKKEGLHENYK